MTNQSQELVKVDAGSVTEQTVKEFLFSSGTKLTPQQQSLFLNLAVRNQLDPFRREIYAIPYGNDFSLVTGYQTYIKRADATGLLNGWNVEPIRDNGKLTGARITIHRKDWSNPFVWEVSREEFDKNSGNWKKMPEFMMKKVAIGQGFRLAFPETLSSLPYLAEEMEDAQPFQQQQLQSAPARPPIPQPQRKSENGKHSNGSTISVAATEKNGPSPVAYMSQTTENGTLPVVYISQAQAKRMFAVMHECGWSAENLKKMLLSGYGIEHSNQVPRDKYDEIIGVMQSMPVIDEEAQQAEGEGND